MNLCFFNIYIVLIQPVFLHSLSFHHLTSMFSIFFLPVVYIVIFKDTHKETTPSNKTQATTTSMNTDIMVVGT